MAIVESKRDENLGNKLSNAGSGVNKELNGDIAMSDSSKAFLSAYQNIMNMLEDSGFNVRKNIERDQPVYEQVPTDNYSGVDYRLPDISGFDSSNLDPSDELNGWMNWENIKKTYSRFGPDSKYPVDPISGLSYKDFLDWKYGDTDDLGYESQRDFLKPYVMSGQFNTRDSDFQQFLNSSDTDRSTYWDIVLDYINDYLSKNKQYGTR